MMKRKQTVFLVLLLILAVLGANLTAWAKSQSQSQNLASGEKRVFDDAGLFSEQEAGVLETEIQSMRKDMNMDVVIVTADNAGGKTAEKYAEDFYIDGKFGTGKDHNGALFLIDMDNRELYILPVGAMTRFLTDKRWNAILDDAYNEITQKKYGDCAQSFLNGVTKYYKAGIPNGQYNYDRETGKISVYRSIRWYEAALAALIGLAAAAVACSGVTAQYSMKGTRTLAKNSLMAYRGTSQFQYANQTDDLINKTVTHVYVPPRNRGGGGGGGGFSSGDRSTTHTSSGQTMGGGGRKF